MTWSNKLKMNEADYQRAMRFNLSFQYYRLVEYLLDTGLPIDRAMARVLISLSTYWNWLLSESCLNWLWFKLNQLGAILLIRTPIEFFWEFSHWAPPGFFYENGLDLKLVKEVEHTHLKQLEDLDIMFDLDIELDEDF